MATLDNINKIKGLDKQNMLGSIESLGLQCRQAWDDVKKVKIPKNYKNINKILINGMGGSGLGGHIINSLFREELKVPLQVINSYRLPAYVDKKTLYIISSYSGTTEEPISTFLQARKKGAKIMVICSGGKLEKIAKKYNLPGYIFTPRFNPCGQPRMGLGYSIIGQVALLKKCGWLNISEQEFNEAVNSIVFLHKKFGVKKSIKNNESKKTAQKLLNKIPIIVGAGHLSGGAHVIANQINENSKVFSNYHLISELNHHLMEGMRFPRANPKNLFFFFIESDLYLPRIKKRFLVTKKILNKYKIPFKVHKVDGRSKLSQVFSTLLFGSYMNFYLAIQYNIDPSPIPWVDFFKKELAKRG